MTGKKLSVLLIVFAALFFSDRVFAQDKSYIPLGHTKYKDTVRVIHPDSTYDRDLFDAISSLFSEKPVDNKIDSITTKPVISVIPAVGYSLQTGIVGTITGNVVFRTAPNTRVSTIMLNPAYTSKNQIIIPLLSNIWTKENKFDFIGDLRFYQYNQNTYGLGSNSDLADEDPISYTLFRFSETALRKIGGNFYAGIGYIFDDRFKIAEKGQANGQVSDFEKYGNSAHVISTGLTFSALFDSRDNTINASKGFYTSLQYRDNYTFLGSTTPWRSLIIDIRKYVRFPANSDNVLAFWSYNWFVLNGRPSYLDLPSTAYDASSTSGRGYIQGRFRGAQMVYLESEYRFKITNNGLLGGVLFVNGETLSATPGSALQRIQPGFGPGLRVKLNKVSKTNIAIDYGFGREGSKGIFINVGEVF